jgi:hypothetical protein
MHDRLEQLVGPRALLGGAEDRVLGIEPQVGLDLLLRALDVSRDQVDLVDHRQELEVVLHRQVQVGHGLRLDALGRVDQQDRALAAHQRAPDLVGKVDVPRRVDQVQLVGLPIARLVAQGDRVALDRDPAFALDVHGVQDLVPEVALVHGAAVLDQAIGQRRLAVVDVRDDAEVANLVHEFPCDR